MTAKKSIRSKKSTPTTRAKKATTVKTEVRRFTDSIEAQAIFLVVILSPGGCDRHRRAPFR